MPRVGVAIASRELIIVRSDEEERGDDENKGEGSRVPYSQEGLAAIRSALQESKTNECLIAGNYNWALGIACALREQGIVVRYLPSPKKARGVKASQRTVLVRAFRQNMRGRLFFREEGSRPVAQESTPHPWILLVWEYFTNRDEILRAKHRILNELRVLFPELVSLGDKLWGKRRFVLLSAMSWSAFEKDVSFENSLARFVPEELRSAATQKLRDQIARLVALEQEKQRIEGRVRTSLYLGDPIVQLFGEDSFSACLLALLVGWRSWGKGTHAPIGWKALRRYAGLAVTQMDSKGKLRISRERPEIRTVLYWLLRTDVGKEVIAQAVERSPKDKLTLPERLEHVLKHVWRQCLQEGVREQWISS